ncbi:MAG: hypothetical protein II336_03350 [Loktanella sp.]|nr:hypothetical protein [Loktanella sp.]
MTNLISRFWHNEDGVITVEAVIAIPFVALAFCAVYVFFDAYRVSTASQKAAYIVADNISRQTQAIDARFILGLNQLHGILARTDAATSMRVSSIGFNDRTNRYVVIWSGDAALGPSLNDSDVNAGAIAARLPRIKQGETLLLVETRVDYKPLFRVGIGERTFEQAVVTRPRFAPQVAFDAGLTIISQN